MERVCMGKCMQIIFHLVGMGMVFGTCHQDETYLTA